MSQFFTTEISDPTFEFDNLRFITVKSNALKKRADITVYVPIINNTPIEVNRIVILLHGVYGSHWAWTLSGGVHKITQQLIEENKINPVVLVMPSDGLFGDGSAYLPHQIENYEQWIVEDVITVVKEQIKSINNNPSIFISGLSMGGYGAMRLGAKYPNIFTSFSGLSSITDFPQLSLFLENNDDTTLKQITKSQDSILQCILKNKNKLPNFRFDCGSEDILIEYNKQLHQSLIKNQIPHIYEEYPGGHEWPYWQTHIKETLIFFNSF